MSSTEKDIYRLVPYRFFLNQTDADVCKLEKLTNLFPDMKAVIELEVFKYNNLNRMIDRLSRIYSISTVIDNRDDTYHVFLGPYHLSLGPAIFGALHFKNISTVLLSNSNTHHHHHKRRHDAVLRRLRRAVRKLILIRSIVDKLRLPSILTPYNQYELYTRGIYDLVLAGHLPNTQVVLDDDEFIQQVNDFRSMNNSERDNSLVASKYMKISTLLHLISPTPHLNQSNGLPMSTKQTQAEPDLSGSIMTNENSSPSLPNSICCAQHCQDLPLVRFPTQRSISHQGLYFTAPDSRTKQTTNSPSRRQSDSLSRRNTATSLVNLSSNTSVSQDLPTFQPTPSFDVENTAPHHCAVAPLFQQAKASQEEALVNTMSSLLSNYLQSQQLTASASSVPASVASDRSRPDFDELLRNIKTLIDERLAAKDELRFQSVPSDNHTQALSSRSIKSLSRNHRKKLLSFRTSSLQGTSLDDFDEEHSESTTSKQKVDVPIKSQSCEELDLTSSLNKATSNETEAEF